MYLSCPGSRTMPVGEKADCKWFGAASGIDVTCPETSMPFGRCETSQRSTGGGDCNKISHQVLLSHILINYLIIIFHGYKTFQLSYFCYICQFKINYVTILNFTESLLMK